MDGKAVLEQIGSDAMPAMAGSVRRTPIYFDSQGQPLFGWVHRPEQACQRLPGVVICPPLGHEQIHSHRSLRHLADALAHAGFAVLRFDYHGTGDSAGMLEEADRHATWLANIRSAAQWLRSELGGGALSLIGIRLGAVLATEVAAAEGVGDLVLWSPFVKGRTYVRELRALGMTAGVATDSGKDIEAAGFVITEQTARDLGGIDLLRLQPHCRRVLLVGRDDMPSDTALLDHFNALGIETSVITPPGYAGMMAEPHLTEVPEKAIADIVAWLGEQHPEGGDDFVPVGEHSTSSGGDMGGGVSERAVCLATRPQLFGILGEPVSSRAATIELPVILLLNAGSTYRVGPNRLYVLLARQLAARGFRCLRMDLGGLGDSAASDPARENDPYPATAFRDIALAMKFIGGELGARQVILMGLCGSLCSISGCGAVSRRTWGAVTRGERCHQSAHFPLARRYDGGVSGKLEIPRISRKHGLGPPGRQVAQTADGT